MKTCPVCGLAARDAATECVQCKHSYLTKAPASPAQSTGPAGAPHGPFGSGPASPQGVLSSEPAPGWPPPKPAGFWSQLIWPLGEMGYGVSILTHLHITRAVADDHVERPYKLVLLIRLVGVLVALALLGLSFQEYRSYQAAHSAFQRIHEQQQRGK